MILIFAGAGASKAVNPKRYPTTVEFFSRLPKNIHEDNLFHYAVQYIEERHEEGHIIDIEQILWLINDLRDFNSSVSDQSTVPGWFIANNRLANIGGNAGHDVRQVVSVAKTVTAKIDTLVSRINTVVYDLYAEPPSKQELADNWLPLLEVLCQTGNLVRDCHHKL